MVRPPRNDTRGSTAKGHHVSLKIGIDVGLGIRGAATQLAALRNCIQSATSPRSADAVGQACERADVIRAGPQKATESSGVPYSIVDALPLLLSVPGTSKTWFATRGGAFACAPPTKAPADPCRQRHLLHRQFSQRDRATWPGVKVVRNPVGRKFRTACRTRCFRKLQMAASE